MPGGSIGHRSRGSRILLLWPGQTKDPEVRGLTRKYVHRIEPFAGIEILEVREKRGSGRMPPDELRKREGRQMLEKLGDRSAVRVAVAQPGLELDSERFAAHLETLMARSGKSLAFFLGGQEGLSPEVLEQAHERISLSRMTFTHELARVILLEQIYRAFTILRGIPYHR
jgi:23S rRNA (pseudouridine1915-N3)-methyltransferase